MVMRDAYVKGLRNSPYGGVTHVLDQHGLYRHDVVYAAFRQDQSHQGRKWGIRADQPRGAGLTLTDGSAGRHEQAL